VTSASGLSARRTTAEPMTSASMRPTIATIEIVSASCVVDAFTSASGRASTRPRRPFGLRRRDRAVLAELRHVDRMRLAVDRHRREHVADVRRQVEHAAALGDVRRPVVPSSVTSPASVPASCPGMFSTSPGASSGSPGNPGG
jgi:hypothetical protein